MTGFYRCTPLPEQRVLVVMHCLSFVQLLSDLFDTVKQRCQGRLLPLCITSSAAAISSTNGNACIYLTVVLSLFCFFFLHASCFKMMMMMIKPLGICLTFDETASPVLPPRESNVIKCLSSSYEVNSFIFCRTAQTD